jgi:hypothetical protein
MFGKCLVCESKDQHISDLKKQIETLNQLIFPPKRSLEPSRAELEMDAILSGVDEAIPVDESSREADLLMHTDFDREEGEL